MNICSIDGCSIRVYCRGWCKKHYRRWERHGDPEKVIQIHGNNEQRFWSKVMKTETCWEWNGALDKNGYGVMWFDGKVGKAHRFGYELINGPIPKGLEPDHLCRNTSCVRPDHLEPVTHAENIRRAYQEESGDILAGPPTSPQ